MIIGKLFNNIEIVKATWNTKCTICFQNLAGGEAPKNDLSASGLLTWTAA